MKSVKSLNSNAISKTEMNNLKGGTNTTVTLETQVDITTLDASGNTVLLYCDRRRKKVVC